MNQDHDETHENQRFHCQGQFARSIAHNFVWSIQLKSRDNVMEFSTLETLKYIFSMNNKWFMLGLTWINYKL